MKILKTLENLVEALLDKHVGGESYFDELDMCLTNYYFQSTLLQKIANDFNLEDVDRLFREKVFVVTGGFGRMFYERFEDKAYIIQVNGRLRKPNQKIIIENMNIDFEFGDAGEYIFLDDSLYQARTLNKVKTEFNISDAYVIYDGSREKPEGVKSLYRYYDHYDEKGKKK